MPPRLITVSGLIAESGKIVFASAVIVRDSASSAVMIPREITVDVVANIAWTVQVPCTDDPGFTPTGWTWEVRPHFSLWRDPFYCAIPYAAPAQAIWFSALVPLAPGTPSTGHTHPISDVSGLQVALDAKLGLLRTWNGSAYVANPSAVIYAGPNDPGAVPDGSIWIDTTP